MSVLQDLEAPVQREVEFLSRLKIYTGVENPQKSDSPAGVAHRRPHGPLTGS